MYVHKHDKCSNSYEKRPRYLYFYVCYILYDIIIVVNCISKAAVICMSNKVIYF